jgi:broad specificity phosphatase PhoE
MTKLIYVTHPLSGDKTNCLRTGDCQKKGLEQAKVLRYAIWKDVDVIYSSIEPKATQVAKLVSEKYNLPWHQDKDLGEADRTATPFLPMEEYMAAVSQAYLNPDANIKGWESHHQMMKRNATVLERIKRVNVGKTVVIVGHCGSGTTDKCTIKGIEPSFDEDPKQTGCYFIADLDTNEIVQDWVKY